MNKHRSIITNLFLFVFLVYPDGDWHYQLTSRTLKSHKGQCRSLPWTFKLIAEELGAEACIAHAPWRHVSPYAYCAGNSV